MPIQSYIKPQPPQRDLPTTDAQRVAAPSLEAIAMMGQQQPMQPGAMPQAMMTGNPTGRITPGQIAIARLLMGDGYGVAAGGNR